MLRNIEIPPRPEVIKVMIPQHKEWYIKAYIAKDWDAVSFHRRAIKQLEFELKNYKTL